MPPVLGLPDLVLESIDHHQNIYLNAVLKAKPSCPRCDSSHVHVKDSFFREINHSRHGNQNVIVRYRSHKYVCKACNKFFNLKIQGLLGKHRSSESFKLDVFERHSGGAAQSYLSQTHGISHATVERWYKSFIKDRIDGMKNNPPHQI